MQAPQRRRTYRNRSDEAIEARRRAHEQIVRSRGAGIDAAVRFGTLNDASLAARRIGEEALILCAHPDYLAANPTIRAVDDLRKHRLIAFRMPTTGRDRPLEFVEHGRTVALTIESRFCINHGEALAEAAALGAGLAQFPEFLAKAHLRSGALVEVLPTCRPAPLPVNLVMPGARTRPARVRALIDALTGEEGSGN
ncbi:substrate binding domain-containing protein [Burkholderia sp. Ac-20344]|uniref:LysR substrate-binding domain-containing protein n=1 Tax=Burkholderia sp. Ac-20344 TaxID=2703890 RepID=UPI00197B9D23|nr:hypothetical protein [Burkholderia sp. Ac-20344]